MPLNNKIDFMLIFTAEKCNPNGDPLLINTPRTDYDGYGEVSDVCLKRKIRNRLQDMGESIIVQDNSRTDDGFKSIRKRAFSVNELAAEMNRDNISSTSKIQAIACDHWIDVRTFGQIFPQKKTVSVCVRGPMSISFAKSLEPVEIEHINITKSTNIDGDTELKDSSTMSTKRIVSKAAYVSKGSIFPSLAEKTGFSEEDAEKIKQALITLFENDASAARPSGSMNVSHLFWWRHPEKQGRYSPIQVFRTIELTPQKEYPYYSFTENKLPGLEAEIYTGY